MRIETVLSRKPRLKAIDQQLEVHDICNVITGRHRNNCEFDFDRLDESKYWKILESAMSGEPVIALCGKVWVPGRDPAKFPICPDCKAIYDGLKPGKGDKDSE